MPGGKKQATVSPLTSAANNPAQSPTKEKIAPRTTENMEVEGFPASPVLHGLKFGCKRKGNTQTPLSGPGKMHRRASSEVLELPHQRKKATLILDDGSRHEGFSFGAETSVSGEVVFNTAMVGYPESLTDPSYRGQILTLTFPLIGNYGVPPEDKDDLGLPTFFESDSIHITALLVGEYSEDSCHWNQVKSLGQWLKEHNVPGLTGMDTRALTKRIRERGAMLGKIVFEGDDEEMVAQEDPNQKNLVAEVSTRAPKLFTSHAPPRLNAQGQRMRVLAVDCGMKANIIRYFMTKGVELLVVPWDHDISSEKFDGLFLSNGPGDPTKCAVTIANIKAALARDVPIFGICLGNQLLALAAGCSTYKMKYGNRGANQPCIDTRTNRCYITAQNHGFAVDSTSMPHGWSEFFVNANDQSNEGIIHQTKPFFSVQFHPEACAGPTDTDFLFDMFLERVAGNRAAVTISYKQPQPAVQKVLLLG